MRNFARIWRQLWCRDTIFEDFGTNYKIFKYNIGIKTEKIKNKKTPLRVARDHIDKKACNI